jgi:hypothetical protein
MDSKEYIILDALPLKTRADRMREKWVNWIIGVFYLKKLIDGIPTFLRQSAVGLIKQHRHESPSLFHFSSHADSWLGWWIVGLLSKRLNTGLNENVFTFCRQREVIYRSARTMLH